MARFKFGPSLGVLVLAGVSPAAVAAGAAAGAPPAVVKADVEVGFAGVRGDLIDFHVPAYDVADFNVLMKIHTVFVPEGHAVPGTPEAAMGPDYQHANVDTSYVQGGAVVTVDGSTVASGRYVGLSVLEFDA